MNAPIDVRPFESPVEYEGMIDYFLNGGEAFQRGMGIDPARLPERAAWLAAVLADHERPDAEKDRLCLAWRLDGALVGHSSASHIRVGEQAHVHLHLWKPELRRGGLGREFFARSVDLYFERLRLRCAVCEPSAANPGPNRTLARLGFRLVRTYQTVPTSMALDQDVTHWEVTREEWRALRGGQPAG